MKNMISYDKRILIMHW